MRVFQIILCLLILVGCEKDPIIDQELPDLTLDRYLKAGNTVIVDSIYAHAGNHPRFEQETDQYNIHLRFWTHPDMRNLKVFKNDSIQWLDSLATYYAVNLGSIDEEQGLFTNVLIPDNPREKDYALMAAYEANDTTFMTRAVRIRTQAQSTDTKDVRSISIETTPIGRAFFDWIGSSVASEDNLVELVDATGETFCAVVCEDPAFLFHNLRNVSHDFTPDLFSPRLIERQEYSAHIYMTDNAGWMRNYRTFSFVADSNKIQFIE